MTKTMTEEQQAPFSLFLSCLVSGGGAGGISFFSFRACAVRDTLVTLRWLTLSDTCVPPCL